MPGSLNDPDITTLMVERIRKCPNCNIYSLENACMKCTQSTVQLKPPKFSLIDKYASLRRNLKKKDLRKRELY